MGILGEKEDNGFSGLHAAAVGRRNAAGIEGGWGLNRIWNDVRTFHKAFGHPAPDKPEAQPIASAWKRAEWIRSECAELCLAVSHFARDTGGEPAPDIVAQADAYIDIIYFAVGGLVELGVQPGKLWDIVQHANMAKLLWPDGKPHLNEEGRAQKPPGWVAPEPLLEAEIQRQIEATKE